MYLARNEALFHLEKINITMLILFYICIIYIFICFIFNINSININNILFLLNIKLQRRSLRSSLLLKYC